MKKIGFIGCGNMGGAIAEAVASSGVETKILLSDMDSTKVEALCKKVNGEKSDNITIARNADVIFLAVKPQVLSSVIDEIKSEVLPRPVVIVSMAAGVEMKKIEACFGGEIALIRIMPNTPVAVGEGMILFATNKNITEDYISEFLSIMECAGKIDRIDEKLIDAASALSGCGPAFVYMFIEALADGAVACGLPRDKALKYAMQTVLGSASLLDSSDKHPGELKDAVCSPGGSTIMGVIALENGAFRGPVMNAIRDAFERTKELGK